MNRTNDPHRRERATVNGSGMSYATAGSGAPIWLLHGNPTWSYIWRNVIPHLSGLGQCIAPDLIGMGDSDKLPDSGPDSYGYAEHRAHLFNLMDQLTPCEKVILVLHDWGGALGFDWARNHADRVRGIAMMEPLLAPYTWKSFPGPAVEAFKAMRSDAGEKMCLEENFFIEKIIPMAVMRELGEAEMAAYRKPYLEPGEGRRPTLSWPRQIPIDGDPSETDHVLGKNVAWLAASETPKLFLRCDPGMMVTGVLAERLSGFPNTTEVKIKGAHYVQEDSPDEIGAAIANWIKILD